MGFTTNNIDITSKGFQVSVLFKTMDSIEFIKRIQDAVRPRLKEVAEDIVREASANAPVGDNKDPRVLSESLTQKYFKKSVGFKVRTNTKRGKSGYGAYVEFGNSRQKKQPFLYPAYDKRLARLKDDLTNVL